MTIETLRERMTAERDIQQRHYDLELRRAADLVHEYRDRKPTGHLAHNLANRATELAAIAAKFESAEAALRALDTADAPWFGVTDGKRLLTPEGLWSLASSDARRFATIDEARDEAHKVGGQAFGPVQQDAKL